MNRFYLFYLFTGSGSCPECQTPLRRVNFRVQLYEDPIVEKDVVIRKRVLRDFNKKEEDFATQREYNDYLEEVEDIIYNLVNDIDVVETNKKIEQYKRENKELILKNKTKQANKDKELQDLIDMEKADQERKRQEREEQEREIKKRKIREKEALIDELMFSEGDAKNIVETYASTMQAIKEESKLVPKLSGFSTGIKFGQQSSEGFLPVPKINEGPKYHYVPITQEIDGPTPPGWKELQIHGYLAHVQPETETEKAGGFNASIACLRALQEAMAGLYHDPSKVSQEITAAT